MAKNFMNTVKVATPGYNVHDLSHDVKMSADMGWLTPTLVLECVPGDKFNIGCESIVRLQPLVAPVMHLMNVSMHYWFVPNRIVWEHWEKFIMDQKIAGVRPAMPYVTVDPATPATYTPLLDYMGIPDPAESTGNETLRINAIPLAAYQKIYNEWYRDQNLQSEGFWELIDGDNNGNFAELTEMRRRGWQHDYFTASLPFAQAGDPVLIPMSGAVTTVPGLNQPGVFNSSINDSPVLNATALITGGAGQIILNEAVGNEPAYYDPMGTLEVANSTITINDLRTAQKLQEWFERMARTGRRYTEGILGHFGVRSSDQRLQRPEYITGTKSPVAISEVLNTTGDTGAADPLPQGNMAGHGIAVTTGQYGHYRVEEHGFIIGIMSIMPTTAYQQGVHKMWLKDDPTQFFWPSFAHLGEEEVQVQELYAYTTDATDTWGYLPRFADYRTLPSRVAGDLRTSLAFWHLGRIFATQPTLNAEFIECVPDDRIFAVTEAGVDNFVVHVYHKIRAVRQVPFYGTPQS